MALKFSSYLVVILISIYFVKIPGKPIYFEFKHQETFALSNVDSDEQDDYDDPDPSPDVDPQQEGRAGRRRRSAKWAPDYDLYARWAEEYYDEYKSAEQDAEEKPKGDQVMLRNKTEDEKKQEREWQEEKKSRIQKAALYGTWALGVLILICCLRIYTRRLLFKCGCDFCSIRHFRRKAQRVAGNFEPGVYIHKNGEKETYPPTEEEIEALRQVKKLMYSLH